MVENPLRKLMREWLPEFDFVVMGHGFARHGRDYVFVLQTGGTFELNLTHVVAMNYETRVGNDVWPKSWDNCLTDYAAWEAAGQPEGCVWGTNWSLAYPGLETPDSDDIADKWAKRIGNPMYAMSLETDRFKLSIIFHDAWSKKLSDDDSIIRQILIPL